MIAKRWIQMRVAYLASVFYALSAFTAPLHVHAQIQEQTFSLEQGQNPIDLIVFPPLEFVTINEIFGPNNEIGLMAGSEVNADIILISLPGGGQRQIFFSDIPLNGGWRQVGDPVTDQGNLMFQITNAIIIVHNDIVPIEILFQGDFRLEQVAPLLDPGLNHINRVFGGQMTLGDLRIEPSLQMGDRATADLVFPSLSLDGMGPSFFLDLVGQWLDPNDLPVDPFTIPIDQLITIDRRSPIPTELLLVPPPPTVVPPQLFDLEECNVRRLEGFFPDQPQNYHAFILEGDRALSLHVVDGDRPRYLAVRAGLVNPDAVYDELVVTRGQGNSGPLAGTVTGLDIGRDVRTFQADPSFSRIVPFDQDARAPVLREGEDRFFSTLNSGNIDLQMTGGPWAQGTLLEVDYLSVTDQGDFSSVHGQRLILNQNCNAQQCLQGIADFVRLAMVERGLHVDPDIVTNVTTNITSANLSFGLPGDILVGKLDITLIPIPNPPTINSVPAFISAHDIVEIEGTNFGDRAEDLCVLVKPDGENAISIPLRVLKVVDEGTKILAHMNGRIPDATPRRLHVSRGIGCTTHFAFPDEDAVQAQPLWVWEAIGVPSAASGDLINFSLGNHEDTCFLGTLEAGVLKTTISGDWPVGGSVSITFTANGSELTLDYDASDICFTDSGSIVDCAALIKTFLEGAFVQEGMSNGNQVTVLFTETMPGEGSLEVRLFRQNGSPDPISSGHITICVSAMNECDYPLLVDEDMDKLDDEWEEDNLIGGINAIFPGADPDLDGIKNIEEFAFDANPMVADSIRVPNITINSSNRPVITFERYPSAGRAFHYSIEYSTDGILWEDAAMFEYSSTSLGSAKALVTATSLMPTSSVPTMLFRLRVSPR